MPKTSSLGLLTKKARSDPGLIDSRAKPYSKTLYKAFNTTNVKIVSDVNAYQPTTVQGYKHIIDTRLAINVSLLKPIVRAYSRATWLAGAYRTRQFIKAVKGKQLAFRHKSTVELADDDFLPTNDDFFNEVGADEETINALTERNMADVTKVTEETRTVLLREVTDGMLKGEGPAYIARQIYKSTNEDTAENVVPMSRYRALMIARTESMYAYRDAARKQMEEAGYTHEKWLAAPGCCDICQSYDGHIYPLGQAPDEHPNGRCVLVPVTAKESELFE